MKDTALPLDRQLAADNESLRALWLQRTASLTARDLAASSEAAPGSDASPAACWLRDGRIFRISHEGNDLYPAFQFVDGRPRTVVRAILSALPEGLSEWQIAFWFASGNGWLDDRAPADCLEDAEAVLHAARRMREPVIG